MQERVYRTPSQDVADPRQRLMTETKQLLASGEKDSMPEFVHKEVKLLVVCFMTALNMLTHWHF